MRIRSSRPPVTRLSRKVLLGLGTAAAIGIGGALFFALKAQHQTGGSELYNTNKPNHPHPPRRPRDLPPRLSGAPKAGASARAAVARRSRPADGQCGGCGAG